jgi:hypothetical protein
MPADRSVGRCCPPAPRAPRTTAPPGKRFGDEAGCTQIQHARNRRCVIEGGHDYDGHGRITTAQDIKTGKAINAGQGQIKQHQVKLAFIVEQIQGRFKIGALMDRHILFYLAEQTHQPFANQRMIFHNQQFQHNGLVISTVR